MLNNPSKWQAYLHGQQQQAIEELLEFIRIPSVSAQADSLPEVRRAAVWVADRLRVAGVDSVEVLETDAHPVVYGSWMNAGADKPTVLIYGHFDVQPAEPLELWTTPPFEPELRDGRIYGRGATDDKGNMLAPILAVEAMLRTEGRLPVNVKFLFEGQEEIGSPDMPKFVQQHADRFACDMIFSADGLQWAPDQPQLVEALKGIVAFEIILRGPVSDQHSGLHGGGIANPAMGLAQLLASMKSAEGLVTVEGFYERVIPLSEDDRTEIARIPYDESGYLAETGARDTAGEPGYSTRERLWARPTIDVNGLTSGWQGDGGKTVLPAEAKAKLTCRLVAAQEPGEILDKIRRHVETHCPVGLVAEVKRTSSWGEPFLVPKGHESTEIAAEVLEEIYGKAPYRTRLGGSISVMTTLKQATGVHATMFGFAHADENLHAPDEFFRLEAFERSKLAYGLLLERVAIRQSR
ncbi:dipeptidase [Rhizobiales bacterium RZME27]|jgi:acetylornithine deacetylase/succinyl-diaminopimelate desuccinylase-like protein|uniref:Dipeptidase n=1 Tax=Endobacterium cereale TaxID=2663029 RepID=A0A6A8ACD4_9HYPH|nr:dipeptidase [Endobacterium cereale]MEB2847004.1 dipeptidase [Endobacterium cereale]MQY47577.1 dipeptidase [Endobacterium cereale]